MPIVRTSSAGAPRSGANAPCLEKRRPHGRRALRASLLLLVLTGTIGLRATVFAAYHIGTYMLPVTDIPEGLHAGDCTGDGIPDVIVAGQGSKDLTILRNIGDGRFGFFTSITASPRPRAAICADLNGDGLPDVASIDRDAGTLNIYIRQQGAGFKKTVSYPTGNQPNSVQAADLNHDGHLDLVTISESLRIMTIRFGDGTGAFPRSITIPLTLRHPRSAAIADFDLDGKLEIAVVGGGTSGTRGMTLFHDAGPGDDGTELFVPSDVTLPSLPALRSVTAADLDGDGIPDLAILSRNGTVAIYLGTPAGGFALGQTLALPKIGQSMDFGDFDGDGVLDIALGLAKFNSVLLLRGLGNLQYAPFSAFDDLVPDDTVVEPQGSAAPRAGTFDDAIPSTDIVTVNPTTRTVDTVDLGASATLQTTQLVAVQDPPQTVLLADMDNDGIADAIVATKGHGGTRLQIFFGNSSGGYDPPPAAAGSCGNRVLDTGELCDIATPLCKACAPVIGSSIVSIAAADFDGDGNQDLLVVGASGRLLLLLGNGKAQFRDVRLLGKTAAKMPAVIGDFDGDGVPDIAAVFHQAGARGLTILLNDGTASFTATGVAVDGTIKPPLIAADFDHNGATDLALGVSGSGGGGIAVLFSDGAGGMPNMTKIPAARGLRALSAADFNEDGWLDLLAISGSAAHSTATFYAGGPGGQFADGVPAIDPGSGAGGVRGGKGRASTTIADINDDRHQDVVVCQSSPATSCTPYFGTGSGTFMSDLPPVASNYVGRQLKTLTVADVDGDGVLDFVGVSRRDARVVVLFRDVAGAITSQVVLPTNDVKPRALAMGDLNGDGLPDLVVANEVGNTITVFLNQGNRQFRTIGPATLAPIGRVPSGVGLVDLDGDGVLDLAISFQGTSNIGFFLMNLDHLMDRGLINIGILKTGGTPVNMIVADVNADGIPDLITVNSNGVPPPDVPPDTGDTAADSLVATQGTGSTQTSTQATGSLTIYRSSAIGTYSRTDLDSGGTNPWAATVADVNHDGTPDLLVINSDRLPATGNLVTFFNDGAGNFTKGTVHSRGRKTPRALCTGDFDGDGNVDVAIASTRTTDIMILFGNGDGTWRRAERTFSVGKFPRALACEDVDGDGKTDVIFGRLNRGDIDVIQTKK